MTKQEVLNSYNQLIKISKLNYSDANLLSKVGINNKLSALRTFRGPTVHINFMEFLKIGDKIIKYIESVIDDNVVLTDITDEYIKVEYVFSDKWLLIDRPHIERNLNE